MLTKIKIFLQQVKLELGKVSWPSKPELIASTLIVIVATVFLASFIGIVDFILSRLLEIVLR